MKIEKLVKLGLLVIFFAGLPVGSAVRAEDVFEDVVVEEVEVAQGRVNPYRAVQRKLDSGEYASAAADLQTMIERDPGQYKAWDMLGWTYWKMGDHEKTIALWNRLRFLDPKLSLPYNLLARVAVETNGLEEAIGYLETSLELNPNQPETVYYLARVLRWSSRFQDSVDMLKLAGELNPEQTGIQLELARAFTSEWNYEQALPLWRMLVEAEPDNVEYASQLALCELHTGNRKEALEQVQQIMTAYPDDIKTLEVAASAAEYSDQPADAVAPLRRLMELQETVDGREKVRVRLIRLLVRLHELDPGQYGLEAPIELAKARIKDFPKSVDSRLLLGELYTMDEQLAKARDPFKYVLKRLNPYNRRAHRGLFEVYLALADFAMAWEELSALASFNPYDPYLNYFEARLHAARGDYFKARESLQKLEDAGSRGAVSCLLYHGLTTSPYFVDALYVERFREHMQAMIDAGFEFVRAEELPELLGPMQTTPQKGKFDAHPDIRVLIDFDDGRRDSMKYGTMVAKELGLVFSMHLPVGYILENNSFICSWEELRAYKATGCWEYGSHLLNAAILAPINAAGKMVHALPNRQWLPEKARLESRSEYLEWLDDEFVVSRRILQEELGGSFSFFSYPFGDLGQEDMTNVKNPVRTILSKAYGAYDVGFIQSTFGYAIAGDNPLLYQRHEIDRWRSGTNLVEYIYEQHPVFLARRMRAEFAALEGKPYLALENLRKLKEDGYPEGPYEKVSKYVRYRLAGRTGAPDADVAETERFWDVDIRKPFVGVRGEYFRDNQERQNWRLSGGGGANLTPHMRVGARAGVGELKQKIVSTNDPAIANRTLSVTQRDVGADVGYTFPNGWALMGDLSLKQFTGDATHNELAYALETQLRPIIYVDVMLRYEHDMVPSALGIYDDVSYDAPMGYAVGRLRDWWDVTLAGARYDFSDDNVRNHFRLGTSWTLWDRTGLNLGINYAYVSADEDSQSYWSPYELNRYYVEAGFKGTYLNTYYDLRFRYGRGRESVRPEAQALYEETYARAIRDQWTELPEAPEADWEPVTGVSLSLKVPLRELLRARINTSYNRLPSYNEFNFDGGLELTF